MKKGINRATQKPLLEFASIDKGKPCIFLSHISLDNSLVEKIGEYIIKAGIDIYLDSKDADLQKAVDQKNDLAVTKFIEDGINKSTHLMCIISEKTQNSWWVPYEIGYGKKASKNIVSMNLKTIPSDKLPSYINITQHLTGIKSLNQFLKNLSMTNLNETPKTYSMNENKQYQIAQEGSIIQESYSYHPLKDYFNQ
ncbi:toll/interleukin-1 receptor domain-containing protein [Schinkia azotoformans]|uniref:toll/interleukin-1 receptor domain-containing protein n=1 Tax=Schinkia azotoformans TaxID=1454 RepID=UPI002DBBBCC7|nr:toll/interleukin-1 receptor domain-containing protein [Schinkia azotoformans]MEC1717789.1 toll/interleukin-1 receptor domain-containing protein [Schinkia azotoformans]MEC1743579.1 toll/interleukin-1 receptor domain-containing protein [Schinkia azotoformans]MEC1746547.1 toll/interleukin-1 receptor domain-containing protein [Schinkia azotoformans]MEC1760225.1 toll/interleukin-1 receptor domain-containing protein [Schinkia azotoformans]MEC1769296.1 toll/interleukin-1 receptor domain-containing